MSDGPENPFEELRDVVDSAANAPQVDPPYVQEIFSALVEDLKNTRPDPSELVTDEQIMRDGIVGILIEGLQPGSFIEPTLEQHARAIDTLKSDWIGKLAELGPDDRASAISELAIESAIKDEKAELSVLKLLLNSDEITWFYISEALNEGPESRMWATTLKLIAGDLAAQETSK